MLQLHKHEVDFLVTENMASEVQSFVTEGFPLAKKLVEEALRRGVQRVYFVACGSPLCACQTAKQLFEAYSSIPCEAYSGMDFLDRKPFALNQYSLVVGVSHYGKTEEVSLAIAAARQAGAMTIAITRDPHGTPLAQEAEFVLSYGGECIWELHLLATYALSLYLMEALYPNAELQKIQKDIEKLPGILTRLVRETEESSKELGIMASKWPMIYTVAAGPLSPLAYKEGIITMLEFTWTHGSVLHASEFRHGPLEVVEEGVPYVFLLGNDASRGTAERALRFVRRFTKDVVVFDVLEYEKDLHPALSPMVLFVPMEYFYYYLSIAKDHNPDDRRYYGGLVEY